jgi:hypothetical protein
MTEPKTNPYSCEIEKTKHDLINVNAMTLEVSSLPNIFFKLCKICKGIFWNVKNED